MKAIKRIWFAVLILCCFSNCSDFLSMDKPPSDRKFQKIINQYRKSIGLSFKNFAITSKEAHGWAEEYTFGCQFKYSAFEFKTNMHNSNTNIEIKTTKNQIIITEYWDNRMSWEKISINTKENTGQYELQQE